MLTRLLTGRDATPRDGPVQGGTTLRHSPSLKTYQGLGRHPPRHRVGNLGSDVPAVAPADKAGAQLRKEKGCR